MRQQPEQERIPDYYWWRMWTERGLDYAERHHSKLPSEARKQHSHDLLMRWDTTGTGSVSDMWNDETRERASIGRDPRPTSSQRGWRDDPNHPIRRWLHAQS